MYQQLNKKRQKWFCFLIALPFFLIFFFTFLSLCILPTLLKIGVVNNIVKNRLSTLLNARVEIADIDLLEPDLIEIKGVKVHTLNPYTKLLECSAIKAKFANPFILFSRLENITLEEPIIEIDTPTDEITKLFTPNEAKPKVSNTADTGSDTRSQATSTNQGIKLNIRGPLNVPTIIVNKGTLKISEDQIIDINGQFENRDGYYLPYEFQGKLLKSAKENVQFNGDVILTKVGGEITVRELKVGDFNAKFGWKTLLNSSKASLNIVSLYISKRVNELLKEISGIDCSGIITTSCSIEIDEDKIQKAYIEGSFDRYHVIFSNIDFAYQIAPSNYKISLENNTKDNSWRITGEITNLEADVIQKYKVSIPNISFDIFLKNIDKEPSVSGGMHLHQASILEKGKELASADIKIILDTLVTENRTVLDGEIEVALSNFKTRFIESNSGLNIVIKSTSKIDSKNGLVNIRDAILKIADIGTISISGEINERNEILCYSLLAKGKDLSISALFNALTLRANPTNISGNLDFEANLGGDSSNIHYAEGFLKCSNLNINYGDTKLENFNLYLPCSLRNEDLPVKLDFIKEGTLRYDKLSIGETDIKCGDIKILCKTNAFYIDSIKFPLFNGIVKWDNIAIKNILTSDFTFETSETLSNIDIGELSKLYKFKRELSGNINGHLSRIYFDGEDIKTEGSIIANIWDGTIKIYDINISKVFSQLANYKFSLNIQDVKAENIPKTFSEFGLIYGVLEGSIKELELTVDGEPIRFEIDLHTVEKDDASQKVSLAAVRSFMILTEGSEAESGYFLKIPHYLHYSHFGVYAILKNDELYIRGKYYKIKWESKIKEYTVEELRKGYIVKDAVEYIMVGRGLKQLNIINLTPAKGILYTDLKENLKKRVEKVFKKEENKK